jgi:hypothetical protein
MAEFIDTPVKRYSSGMQVKLAFAVATSIEAEILIVDEVLAVGDLAFQRKCFDRMEYLIKRQGRTVLLVSHNIRQVERICSRVITLDHGRKIDDGEPMKVCNAFYERSDRIITMNQASLGKSNIQTTGEVELLDVFFVNKEKQRTNAVGYDCPVTLHIRVQAHKPIINPFFFVGFHTTDFVFLTASSSGEMFRTDVLTIGTHELSMIINKFPLLPGAYSTRISIDVEEPIKNILYGDGLCHFTVVSSSLQRTAPECGGGFFMVETKWQLAS